MKFYKHKHFPLYIIVYQITDRSVHYRGIAIDIDEAIRKSQGTIELDSFRLLYKECEFDPIFLKIMTPLDAAKYRKSK